MLGTNNQAMLPKDDQTPSNALLLHHTPCRHRQLRALFLVLGRGLGQVGEHGGALGRLVLLGARLLKQGLRPRAAPVSHVRLFHKHRGGLLLHGVLGLEGGELLRRG
jgi:hypothetical protein